MIRSLLAATAVLSLATAAQAQTPAPLAAQGQPADVGLLPGAELSADCGGLNNLAGRAWCVTAPLGQVGALADAYIADLATKGWLAAGGDENRVVVVKRCEGGGYDGMQMIAFYDTSKVAVPAASGFLGFATIPGEPCATPVVVPSPEATAGSLPQ